MITQQQVDDLKERMKAFRNSKTNSIPTFLAKKSAIEAMKSRAENMLKGVEKNYNSLKREHCDGCEKNYECPTCKPEFDKLRKLKSELMEIIDG